MFIICKVIANKNCSLNRQNRLSVTANVSLKSYRPTSSFKVKIGKRKRQC